MAFRPEFAAEAERDFGLIFDHLLRGYLGFGESPESAFDHAELRTAAVRGDAERILAAPYRGERHDDMQPGLRHLAIGRAQSTGSTLTSPVQFSVVIDTRPSHAGPAPGRLT